MRLVVVRKEKNEEHKGIVVAPMVAREIRQKMCAFHISLTKLCTCDGDDKCLDLIRDFTRFWFN